MLSDVFSSSRSPSPRNSHASTRSAATATATAATDAPDVRKLRQTHTTSGYRDGISTAKPLHIQDGFDEGYPLGGRIGQQVGWILGALGVLARAGDEATRKALREAETQLAFDVVFGERWWDERGVWKWSVEGEAGGADGRKPVTLDDVVMAFPLLKSWRSRVTALLERSGLACVPPWEDAEDMDGVAGKLRETSI